MLVELTIRDFAIVEQLRIAWDAGLNVLTGETGAGKSIIVDAVGALLGDRQGPETVRGDRERAFVEGIFLIDRESPAGVALHDLLAPHALLEEDGQLMLSREIARTGQVSPVNQHLGIIGRTAQRPVAPARNGRAKG